MTCICCLQTLELRWLSLTTYPFSRQHYDWERPSSWGLGFMTPVCMSDVSLSQILRMSPGTAVPFTEFMLMHPHPSNTGLQYQQCVLHSALLLRSNDWIFMLIK